MPKAGAVTLSQFITDNTEAIVTEWLAFAMTLGPAASTMTAPELRDHAKPILQAIARDLVSAQTDFAQSEKSKGLAPPLSTRETAAAAHGALRQVSGFDMNQLGAEYRALRASVIRLWTKEQLAHLDSAVVEDMVRFNEAVDQAVAESTARYAAEMALSRDTFMAILAHDLRSPLNAINMLADMLERAAGTDSGRQQSGQIRSCAKEMGKMIGDLLEYSRTSLGKGIPVTTSDCDIAGICRAVIDELRAGYPTQVFKLDLLGNLRGHVDAGRLRQALSNLLNNAAEHCLRGSEVSLTATSEGSSILLQVRNLGDLIPRDSLQVIFDPLVQLSTRSTVKTPRTSTNLGLGLFIAREIVLGHHGTIEAQSSSEEGTVFTIRLPIAAVLQPAAIGR